MLREDSRPAPRRDRIQPRKISISLKIAQFRLLPTAASTKRGIARKGGRRNGRRNFRYYPDGKRKKKTNVAVIFRNTAAGFNGCADEKSSEIRIACAICKMNRAARTIIPTIKEIGYKAMIASHFILFFSTTIQTQKSDDRLPASR